MQIYIFFRRLRWVARGLIVSINACRGDGDRHIDVDALEGAGVFMILKPGRN